MCVYCTYQPPLGYNFDFNVLANDMYTRVFILFRAIKSQLEKGPVDVITGEARNSLSEEKLLRQHLDVNVVEGVVENENEVIPIKLLDTDTISQAKENILDALYKNTPVSRRPELGEVDLELRRGNARAGLYDYNEKDGEWVKVNTHGHDKLDQMGSEAGSCFVHTPIESCLFVQGLQCVWVWVCVAHISIYVARVWGNACARGACKSVHV